MALLRTLTALSLIATVIHQDDSGLNMIGIPEASVLIVLFADDECNTVENEDEFSQLQLTGHFEDQWKGV